MSLNRTSSGLAAGILVLLTAVSSFGQDLRDLKLFEPVDIHRYGTGPLPHEGFFFVFDGLKWYISTPETATVGFPGLTRNVFFGPDEDDQIVQSNTLNTGQFEADPSSGNRFEFGRIVDRRGWFFSGYKIFGQNERLTRTDVPMVFFDPEFGPLGSQLLEGIVGQDAAGEDVIRPLPLEFDDVLVENHVDTWSIEFNLVHRSRHHHYGGVFELYGGVRFMEFDEHFQVTAIGFEDQDPEPTVPSILADSQWTTRALNEIVGPQLGARWFKICNRWMLSTEARFLSGFNAQSIRQRGVLGDKLNPPGTEFQPLLMEPTSFEHSAYLEEFTPVVELRAEFRYQVTKAISFRAGWTGIWMDNIARPSDMVRYQVPEMGILTGANDQDVFINGWNLGVDVNR